MFNPAYDVPRSAPLPTSVGKVCSCRPKLILLLLLIFVACVIAQCAGNIYDFEQSSPREVKFSKF